jgi:hypothetical protein
LPRTARNRAPVIGRFGGLPAETVEAFSTALCGAADALAALESELAGCREALADRLHDAVPDAAPELRRLLLAVRRDCHNGRGIARHRRSPQWPLVADAAGPLAGQVGELEERVADGWAAFRGEYEAERDRQRGALREPLRDRAFMRGLALASPDLYDACRQLAASPTVARKHAKSEAALLRYVVRAALKTSPFSTFTPVSVGAADGDAGTAGLRISGGETEPRSLVRLKRFRLGQLSDALCRYAPFRDGLRVVLNDSAEDTEPGRALLLRPGCWEGAADRGTLRYRADALVRVGIAGPLVRRAMELLAEGRHTFGELVARIEGEGAAEDAASARSQLERLAELGMLRLVLPWPSQAGHLEARMCDALRALPYDAALEPFISRLERLVALEEGYAQASDPAAALREMRRLVDELWDAAAALGGPSFAGTAYRGTARYDLYEDVLLVPGGAETAPAFHLSGDAARRALRSAEPLADLAALCDDRQDFRAALAAFAAETWPGRGEVGVLELFSAAQPLWQEYLAFRAAGFQERDPGRTWNPRGLPEVETLRACRAMVMDRLAGCVETLPDGGACVDEDRLRSLIGAVPSGLTDGGGAGACLFLQPASRDGSLWRLNAVREGTGRCGSRYTPAMPAALRREYAAHLRARGTVTVDGERAELLDLFAVQGDTLNVHAPQTPAVLAFPGERTGVAPHRRVPLGGLRVCFDGGGGRIALRGVDGRRFVPVHLGLAYEAYMPPVVRFLMALGPSERGSILPPAPERAEGDVRIRARTTLGNLVVHRRAWSVPAAPLAAALAATDDARAFADANRLRAGWGIPERAFVREAMTHPLAGTVRKPRYVDFTSPLFLSVLRELAATGEERITVEEMLPDPAMLPRDAAGRSRAVEVLVDSLALRRRTQRAEAAPLRRTRARTGRTPAGTAAG